MILLSIIYFVNFTLMSASKEKLVVVAVNAPNVMYAMLSIDGECDIHTHTRTHSSIGSHAAFCILICIRLSMRDDNTNPFESKKYV